MPGPRKPHTLARLDRSNVLPFMLSKEQVDLYEKDPYKWLIHFIRTNPNDDYRIMQFLFLKFYPLIVKICGNYRKMMVGMDWTDLVSKAKNLFIELVFRFDLNSTLFFRTYIPIALSRSLYDFYLYEKRREGLIEASSLDGMEQSKADVVIRQAEEQKPQSTEYNSEYLDECKKEIKFFVDNDPNLNLTEKMIFEAVYFESKTEIELSKEFHCSTLDVKLACREVLDKIKSHLQDNFL